MSVQFSLTPTPTELDAHRRRAAFYAKIAKTAEALAAAKFTPEVSEVLRAVVIEQPSEIHPVNCPVCLARERAEGAPVAYPQLTQIIKEVARYFGVSVHDIKSQRRTKDVVWPRQVAVYLCKQLTPQSLPMIGRFFGGRDHTTALHSVRKVERLCLSDLDVAFDVATLFDRIAGGAA